MLVVLGTALLARRRGPVLATAAAIALQFLSFVQVREPAPAAPPAACRGGGFSVATVNLWFRNGNVEAVLDWLREHPADVVALQELTPAWQAVLEESLAGYPYRYLHAREDAYGIGVLSRGPLVQARTADLAGDGLPSLVAVVEVGGQRLQVVNMHTHWPVLPDLHRARDLALQDAASAVRGSPLPSVLAGDLNLTPYAPAFGRLAAGSGLRDALAARAWRPTWMAGFWPLALPIDHVLVPESTCVVATSIGPDIGSDHRPVHVSLRWR